MSEKSLKERFQEKLDGSRWTGSTNNIGYPKMKVDGEMVLGSHVALRLAGRKAPTGGPAGGKIVMHKDNNKLNLSPSNLAVGTHKANLKQMRDEGRDRPRGVHQEPDEKTARVRGSVKQLRRAMELIQDGSTAYHAAPATNIARIAEGRVAKAGRGQVYGKGVYFQTGAPSHSYGPASFAVPAASHTAKDLHKLVTTNADGYVPHNWRKSSGEELRLSGKEVLIGHGYGPRKSHLDDVHDAVGDGAVLSDAARKGRLRYIPASQWELANSGISGHEAAKASIEAAKRDKAAVSASLRREAAHVASPVTPPTVTPAVAAPTITAPPSPQLSTERPAPTGNGKLLLGGAAAAGVSAGGLALLHGRKEEAGKTASTDIDILKFAFRLQGETKFQDIPIAIENRKGSVRKGVDKDGKPWRTVMKMPYGYIKGSKGADGEDIDCYVGPHKDAPNAYVVHQRKSDGTGYDEDKVLLGLRNKEEATRGYLAHYNSDKFLGPVKEVPVERLKEMLSTGKKLEKISTSLCARVLRRG